MFCNGTCNNCFLENSNLFILCVHVQLPVDPCAMLTQEGPSRHTCSPSLTSLCVCVCVCAPAAVTPSATSTNKITIE